MRIAILSAVKATASGETRAFLPLFGRSVLAWQVDCALRWGCERIICLSEASTPDLIAVQQEVEARGCEFHVVRGHAKLVALLSDSDDLLVMMDGLIAERDAVDRLSGLQDEDPYLMASLSRDCEAAQQAPDDFERIDAQRHWGGIAVLPATAAQKLAECPPDGDTLSLLLRLGLQSGVRCESLGGDPDKAPGTLAISSEAIAEFQRKLIAEQDIGPTGFAPFTVLATLLAKPLAMRQSPRFGYMTAIAALMMVMIGATVVWVGYPLVGLIIAAFGLFVQRMGERFDRLRSSFTPTRQANDGLAAVSWAADAVVVVTLIGALPQQIELWALPIFAVGLSRLAISDPPSAASEFWNDRALQMAGFTAAYAFGVLAQGLAVFGMLALGYKMLQSRPK